MPLLIVVAALIVIGVIWRGRVARRLTIEESVDRYRRTLSAVHDAATRSRAGETPTTPAAPAPTFNPIPAPARASLPSRAPSRTPAPRRTAVVAVVVVAAVIVVAVIVASTHGGNDHPRVASTSSSHPTATRPSTTTTTIAAPTTTRPLVSASDTTGSSFVIGKPSYTLVLAAADTACWVEARDAAGTSLFTGLLDAGASQSITATTAVINLGNPGTITVTVDGTRVPFTTHNGAPLTLHFQGVA